MAVMLAGIADTDGIQLTENSVVFAASGGTLDASNLVQVNWDSTAFGSADGKLRLAAALELISQRIENTRVWPVTSSS